MPGDNVKLTVQLIPSPNLSASTSNRSRPELMIQLANPGQTTVTNTITSSAPTAAKMIRK